MESTNQVNRRWLKEGSQPDDTDKEEKKYIAVTNIIEKSHFVFV